VAGETEKLDDDEDFDEVPTYARATEVISKDGIRIDGKAQCFIVTGTAENRIVTLFPKKTCSCPATTTCYHILVVQIAVGIGDTTTKRPKNSTRYRKNAKKILHNGCHC
jgi:hypothetical protein